MISLNVLKSKMHPSSIVAILFAIRLPTFFISVIRDATPSSSLFLDELNGLLAVAPHLLLFPVVAALPAPRWAKAAGYGWLVIDISTDIMGLNGVPQTDLSLVALRRAHFCSPLDCIGLLAGNRHGAYCRLALSIRPRHLLVHCLLTPHICCTGGTPSLTGKGILAGTQ